MRSSVSSYCSKCGASQIMTKLRPYVWTGKAKVQGTEGFGLTGECAACGTKKDFVVSESLYMALSKEKQIDNG